MSSSLFAFHHMIPSPWDLIYVVIGCLMMPATRLSLVEKVGYPSSLGLFWSPAVSKSMDSKGFGVKVDQKHMSSAQNPQRKWLMRKIIWCTFADAKRTWSRNIQKASSPCESSNKC